MSKILKITMAIVFGHQDTTVVALQIHLGEDPVAPIQPSAHQIYEHAQWIAAELQKNDDPLIQTRFARRHFKWNESLAGKIKTLFGCGHTPVERETFEKFKTFLTNLAYTDKRGNKQPNLFAQYDASQHERFWQYVKMLWNGDIDMANLFARQRTVLSPGCRRDSPCGRLALAMHQKALF